jgi:hypothetical protein
VLGNNLLTKRKRRDDEIIETGDSRYYLLVFEIWRYGSDREKFLPFWWSGAEHSAEGQAEFTIDL